MYVTKGVKVLEFKMKAKPDQEELLGLMLGRTGNLRAPTLRSGKTLFVGFPKGGFEAMQ